MRASSGVVTQFMTRSRESVEKNPSILRPLVSDISSLICLTSSGVTQTEGRSRPSSVAETKVLDAILHRSQRDPTYSPLPSSIGEAKCLTCLSASFYRSTEERTAEPQDVLRLILVV